MTTPTGMVSILVPVYNRAHCIAETLDSALAQTWRDIEVVVVDNASTDATWPIVQAVAARDPRIRAFRNDSNVGPVRNWLRCLAEARGDFGKILWSDDLMHPEFLAQALPCLADPEVGFVYSPALVFEGEDPLAGMPAFASTPAGRRSSAEFIAGSLLEGDYPVSPGCALFRLHDMRECLPEQVPNRVGSDFAMLAIGNDLLLFLQVAARYRYCCRLEEPMSYFRSHPGSITVSSAPGRIPLHYAIAKAWFLSRHPQSPRLQARFNALLLVQVLVFRGNPQGLARVADFYPAEGAYRVSYSYLAYRLLRGAWRQLVRRRHG